MSPKDLELSLPSKAFLHLIHQGARGSPGIILLRTCRKANNLPFLFLLALLTSIAGEPLWVHLGLGPCHSHLRVRGLCPMQAPGSLLLSRMHSSVNTIGSNRRSGHMVHPCVCLHNELSVPRKLAQKRKETMSSTRQEMTVMVSSMDKSYAEQGTSCDEAFSFMDTHNLNGRCEWAPFPPSGHLWGPGVRKQNLPRQSLGPVDFASPFR